jgi:autotransporter-associated beta strand protein
MVSAAVLLTDVRAETNVWAGLGGTVNWSTGANWTNGAAPVGSSELVVVITGTNNNGITGAPLLQDVADPLDLNRLEFADVAAGDREVFLAGGRLNFVANGGVQPTVYNGRDSNPTLRTPATIPAGTTLYVNNRTYRIYWEGAIDGAGGLVFGSGSSGGELELKSSASTYSGGTLYQNIGNTNVQWARLRVSVSNAFGVGPVTLNGGNLTPLSAANQQAGGLTFQSFTAQTNSFSLLSTTPIFAGEGLTNVYVAAASVVLSGPFNLGTNALYLRGQRNTSGALSGTLSGDGPAALVKMDLGTWTLSGANTFTGRVSVADGILKVGGEGAFSASAPLQLSGGLLDLGGYWVTNGPVTISAGALSNGTLCATAYAGTDAGVISASLAGSGGLVKGGAGTLTLASSNLYSGATTVNAGILQIVKRAGLYNGDEAQWTDANIVVNSGATLAFSVGGAGEFAAGDIGLLSALGSASGGYKSGSLLGFDTTGASGGSFAYDTAIANPGGNQLGIHKLGAGTLALGGANTYTGPTRLAAGVLSVSALANGGLASGIGASTTNRLNLVFEGGTLRYTGPTVSTDRKFTITAGRSATFDVTQPGATLTFSSVTNSYIPSGVIITKNGPGALSFGMDGPGGGTWFYLAGINTLVINEGSFWNVAGDTPQINVSAQAATGPALVLGDGAYLGCSVPVDVTASNTEQVVSYIGTNATATIAAGLFSGPTAGGSNVKTLLVSDGAADVDLLASASFGIYPTTPAAVSDIRKTGAGTLKLSGTASQFRGTMTVRNGRLVVGSNVPYGGNSVLGNATSVVQVADAGTLSTNHVALVFDGAYTFSRGICVNPYGASATVGNVSTSRAVFAAGILLSNTVQFVSSSAGTNVTLISGLVSGHGGLTKTGTGTVVVAAANTYTGLTTVAAGTLRLAAAERLADASGLRLTGGAFDAAGFSETLGALDVDGDAVIDFGTGASQLRFAASAGQTWSGTVTLRNWSGAVYGGGADRLYVGSVSGSLTEAQLARILLPDGRKVMQLATGEIVPVPEGTIIGVR